MVTDNSRLNKMKIGLFIPCYVNAVYPQVGVASYRLLRHLGLDVDYPADQTCCGQPMANAGFEDSARELAEELDDKFAGYDYVVGPSASCAVFIKDHYPALLKSKSHRCHTEEKVYDICGFIHDIVRPASLDASFPHKVSIHNSCHGVRLLGLSSPSERNIPYYNKLRNLLSLVRDIEIVEPERPDECCGFGGMFSIEEDAVSLAMGRSKIQRHMDTGAEYITGADSSCLMHQEGIIRREHLPIKTIHIVEILAGGLQDDSIQLTGSLPRTADKRFKGNQQI